MRNKRAEIFLAISIRYDDAQSRQHEQDAPKKHGYGSEPKAAPKRVEGLLLAADRKAFNDRRSFQAGLRRKAASLETTVARR